MVDRAALEMRWAARSRGFESLPLRHLAKPNGVNAERSKLTPGGNRGGIGAKPQALGHSPEGTESIPPSPPSFALWASDGTANFENHKIRVGLYSATAKDALHSLGEGGSFPMGFGWHGQLQSAHYARAHSAVLVLMRAQRSTV